ncbi:sensor histidine kinase [Desulfosporosinus sp. BICA1-9]|uniref:sensor histidine kinase n=1 Tax=Desulfosporosinus sp. BICA1-9 TaxID=1531958 RepID=UPI00054BC39C|nr:ATP-binding protein [Desulfosporosinus sp. BICA1-9]KJS46700.1 MAG: histidine kinase [Peptococcaceae bacterium BRH_c23]KJS83802.1 MAG: histidine kinase [Desulfosporosinus sp. BICA1-9]HBW36047.1 ATP-binding protein [Desulfosporosinus sp.]
MLKNVFRRQAYYIASVAFIVLGLVYFIVTINHPYIGLNIENVNGQWLVIASDPYGEGYLAGVRVGDIVLKINEDVPSKYSLAQKWSQVEGASSIEFRRPGQPTDNLIKLQISTDPLRNLKEVPLQILGFVFWLLGFMTWFKRPFLAQARSIFWFNWIIGLAIVFVPASGRCLFFARELEYMSMSLVPIFLINLVSIFPREKRNRVNQFSIYMVTIISIIIIIFTILQSIGIINNVSLLRKLVLSTVIIALLLALWNLGSLIKLPKESPERNQTGILFMSMVIGFFPFVLLTAVPQLFNIQPIRYSDFSSLFLSVVPVAWYYVIVNKYLPDSRRLLGTILSFFIVGVIISFVLSYVLYFLKVVKTLNLEVYIASLFLTILFIVCISFMRAMIRNLLEKFDFFYGNKGFRERVLKLNESLTSINEEDRILEEVVKSLSIEGAFIVVEDGKGGYLKKAHGMFLEKPSQQIELEEFFQADNRVNLEAKILPESFPAEIYIPVVSDDFYCGIFLGHHYSHVKFERDELPLITLISSQLAQRLITTFVIKELSKEIEFLAQRSQDSQRRNQGLQGITTSLVRSLEKERKLIASDINNGPLQLGLDLNRWLKYLIEECPTESKTAKAISHMRELVENLNFELRVISNDLRPPSLTDLGLLTAVELMCEEIMLKELSIISLETVGFNREDRYKEEVELAAYRFLQEGIMNAVKHSGSNKIKLFIEMTESNLELTVRDSGKGFYTIKIDDWSLTSDHFGIVGMKERIESLGGNLQISSEIHRGTMLKAVIPII